MLSFVERNSLENALQRNEDLYSICIEATGAGPLDGCCYATAKALQTVIGGDLYTLHGRGNYGRDSIIQGQHVLLKKDGSFWDADGYQSEETILKQWPLSEGVFDIELRPFVETDVMESPRSESLIAKIVEHFNKALELNTQAEANDKESFKLGM
jgi:hypothetical protein